jgi:hypothetical protein
MDSKITYKNSFDPCINSFVKIELNEPRRRELATKINNLIIMDEANKKRKLYDYEVDVYRKIFMKLAGDLVIEQFLELSFVDLNANLNIKKPEINKLLKNTEVDVCTFTYGVFPLVYKLAYRKTIFICMLPNKKDYYICGVANPMIVSGFSDKNLVLSSALKDNKRAGFFGFSRLTPLPNNINNFMRIIS